MITTGIVLYLTLGICIGVYAYYNAPQDHDNVFTDDNYAECHRPHIALKDFKANCQHQGEKTDVVVWTTATCETVQTICDDCGASLGEKTDC